jgi:hypothetical protein
MHPFLKNPKILKEIAGISRIAKRYQGINCQDCRFGETGHGKPMQWLCAACGMARRQGQICFQGE